MANGTLTLFNADFPLKGQDLQDGSFALTVSRQVRKGTPAITAAAPTTSATLLIAANAARIVLEIFNNSAAVLFVSPSAGVTIANGIPIPAAGVYKDEASTGAWYGVMASITGDARMNEIS